MPSRDLASQLWLTALLGTLSVISIYIIVEDEAQHPGHASRGRQIVTQASIDELNAGINTMLLDTQDWEGLCRKPLETLLTKSRLAGRNLVLQDEKWLKRRKDLSQWERDALTRCQAASQGKNDRICFHVSAGPQVVSLNPGVWSSPVNLVEMRLEFHDKAGRMSCDRLKVPAKGIELMAYYTAYWEENQSERKFQRVSGGSRFKVDVTFAQSAEPSFEPSFF